MARTSCYFTVYVQRTIFVTTDGPWTAVKNFEHEKPPAGRLRLPRVSVQEKVGGPNRHCSKATYS
jgi:hypothetical protein